MGGVLDKVLLAGFGLENRVRKKIDSLAREGQKETEEGMAVKEDIENRMVQGIVDIVGSAMKKVGVAKKEVDDVIASVAEDLAERLKIVTIDDLDVVEKLVMVNREKTSKLEKRIKALEDMVKELSEAKEKK